MTITAIQARQYAASVAGGTPELFSLEALVNMAGRQLVSLHPWGWLRAPEVMLDLIANQSWIDLPLDFGRQGAIETTGASGYTATFVPLDILDEYRNADRAQVAGYALAVTYGPGASPNYVPHVPRLEVWPTPSATVTDALRMFYYRRWTEVSTASGSTHILNFPPFMDMLYWRVLRETVMAFEEDDIASLEQRIGVLVQSSLFTLARREDMAIHVPPGGMPMLNGIGHRHRSNIMVYPDSVPAP